jgi:hypothetical protein
MAGTENQMSKQATAMEYVSKQSAQLKREKKSVIVERALDELYEKHGTITTDLVIEEASKSKHPLHPLFDWDNAVAGHKWRQTQALAMIMATKYVVVLEKSKAPPRVVSSAPVRKFVNAFRGEGFKMRNEVLNEDDARKAMVEKKLAVLRSWCRETVDISELAQARAAILKFL